MSANFQPLHKQGPLLYRAVLHMRALPCRCGWRNTNRVAWDGRVRSSCPSGGLPWYGHLRELLAKFPKQACQREPSLSFSNRDSLRLWDWFAEGITDSQEVPLEPEVMLLEKEMFVREKKPL